MTDLTTTSSARIASSGAGSGTSLDTVDAAVTGVTAIVAMTSATLTGGESPTEAEHNALRVDVVNTRTRLEAIATALAAVG